MKKLLLPILLSASMALITGCAGQRKLTETQELGLRPIFCSDQEQCDLFWKRAQYWVSSNAGYRIQMANDVIIQTYGPEQYQVKVAALVTKEVSTNGGSIISIKLVCGNMFGCQPDTVELAGKFRRYVGNY